MWKNIVTLVLLIVTVYFASGCTSDSYEFDPTEYTYPVAYTAEVYEVVHDDQEMHQITGYTINAYEVDNGYLTDDEKQAYFDEWRTRKEEQDKYDSYFDAWDTEDYYISEQKRIEAFCEEEGFFGCYDIKYTCEDEYTCKRVFSECEETDFEPERLIYNDDGYHNKGKDCDHWDIHIEDTDFDIRMVSQEFLDEGGFIE